ncbi:F0F1 ATP synthase subunit C [Brockia lithotrophica]|uniref:ATP synthase subunit c n=1 Tax=Brockia lithotrophica TaxID=933949 RepID=A0A660KVG6_9BACL|nr:F0F1 ATP synthase subunit C [Brockia lithotrophica]RKQ83844.1 F-type H+-transporting ATPase subunit c [Brockia lithotrophica]
MTSLLAVAIIAAAAALAAAIGDAIVVKETIASTARQPEYGGQFRTTMFIGIALIEALPIIAIVIAFILLGR